MFGKKNETPKKPVSKAEQLGPKPDDLPNTKVLRPFQVILKNNLPSVEVLAHAHNFGEEVNCDRPRSGQWTHFVVYGDTTWVPNREYVDTVRGPLGSESVYRWKWVKDVPVETVFSIRTADVAMVAAVDNAKAVEAETFNVLDRHELTGPSMMSANPYGQRADGGPVFDVIPD